MLKTITVTVLMFSVSLSSFATNMKRIQRRGEKAGAVLHKMSESNTCNCIDATIPASLLSQAKCVAVFPAMFKAALGPLTLGMGGQKGKGLVSCKQNGVWGAPVYVNLSAASVGLQFGIQKVDQVLVYVGDDSIDEFTRRNFSANAEAAATVGPIGRSATLGTDIKFETGIYSYSHSKGLFAGLALGGLTVSPDKEANKAVYGEDLTPADILSSDPSVAPASAQAFLQALAVGTEEIVNDSDDY